VVGCRKIGWCARQRGERVQSLEVTDYEGNGQLVREGRPFTGEANLDLAGGGATVEVSQVAVVTVLVSQQDPVPASGYTSALGAIGLELAERAAAVAEVEISVVALLGSLGDTVAARRTFARFSRLFTLPAFLQRAARRTPISRFIVSVVARLEAHHDRVAAKGGRTADSRIRATPARFELAGRIAPVAFPVVAVVTLLFPGHQSVSADHRGDAGVPRHGTDMVRFDLARHRAPVAGIGVRVVALFRRRIERTVSAESLGGRSTRASTGVGTISAAAALGQHNAAAAAALRKLPGAPRDWHGALVVTRR
jgi:hypothetical protein